MFIRTGVFDVRSGIGFRLWFVRGTAASVLVAIQAVAILRMLLFGREPHLARVNARTPETEKGYPQSMP